jgi:hypothetical protein
MTTWHVLADADRDLAAAGRKLLLNCAPTWGVALLGTTRSTGAPRISPLCIYITDDRLLVTIDGWKEKDLQRDPRYSLHTYWSDGQDEFAVDGRASDPLGGDDLALLVALEPRLQWSPIVRELTISSAHSVIYRNFPGPGMVAEVSVWTPGAETRRWVRDEPTPEDTITATA